MMAGPFQEEPGGDGTDNDGKKEGDPQSADILDGDGGNAGSDHQVKEEAGETVEKIIVAVLLGGQTLFVHVIKDFAHEERDGGTNDKVESPEQRIDGLPKTG